MIAFLLWFLITVAVFAIVIIAGKWLLGLAGVAVPRELALILGIILFIILLLALWHFVGSGMPLDYPRR
jgi:hypothetical protein